MKKLYLGIILVLLAVGFAVADSTAVPPVTPSLSVWSVITSFFSNGWEGGIATVLTFLLGIVGWVGWSGKKTAEDIESTIHDLFSYASDGIITAEEAGLLIADVMKILNDFKSGNITKSDKLSRLQAINPRKYAGLAPGPRR